MADHKTKEMGPAMVTLEDAEMEHLQTYIEAVRPQLDPQGTLDNVFLQGAPPSKVTNLQHLIRHLQKKYNIEIPTATKFRKAVASQAVKSFKDKEVATLAKTMSHSVGSHKRTEGEHTRVQLTRTE